MGGLALAFAAGVISFSSPCCLPLMPGYVSYVSGVAGGIEVRDVARHRVMIASAFFVVGFAIVFTTMGAGASAIGSVLLRNRLLLTRVAGGFILALGLVNLGIVRFPALMRERRVDLRRVRPGAAGALPLGMAFAIGWTPCIGPVLAGILTIAASTTAPIYGAGLLLVYSLGLGVPFLLLAFGFARQGSISRWLRRHGRGVERVGGVMLVAMGILMITGTWLGLFTPLLRLFSRSGWPPL